MDKIPSSLSNIFSQAYSGLSSVGKITSKIVVYVVLFFAALMIIGGILLLTKKPIKSDPPSKINEFVGYTLIIVAVLAVILASINAKLAQNNKAFAALEGAGAIKSLFSK